MKTDFLTLRGLGIILAIIGVVLTGWLAAAGGFWQIGAFVFFAGVLVALF